MFEWRIDDDLTLRQWEQHHAEAMFALTSANREHLRPWLGWVDDESTIDDTRDFIRMSQQQSADNSSWSVGIWYRGALAGTVAHHRIKHVHRSVALGYWLGAAFEGKGIMTRTCRAFIGETFATLGLNRVEIRAATGNTHSQRVAERLGFTREGQIRDAEWLYDHYVDHAVYGMLARDWQS